MPAASLSREHAQTDNVWGAVLFLAAHVMLAFAIRRVPQVAIVHAGLVFAIGLWWALTKPLNQVALVGAYIVGAEVLWRMNEVYAVFPWEFGKYGTVAIFSLAIARARTKRTPPLALFYFLLLLPSILNLLPITDFAKTFDDLSFNLSGPLTLLVCAWLYANITITLSDIKKQLIVLIAPCVTIATQLLRGLTTTSRLEWAASASSVLGSGGYGPNQMSAVLGLAVVAIWFLLLYTRTRGLSLFWLMSLGLWFLAHALLTFSRGGIVNALASAATVTSHALLDRRLRGRAVALLVVAVVALTAVLIPRLEALTAQTLGARFTDPSLTGRDELAQAELQAFRENMLLGVGPGQAQEYRTTISGRGIATHTEYTRLLAEHGLLGLVAIVLLLAAAWRNYKQTGSDLAARSFIAAVLVWALVFMVHSAMRLAAPSLLVGMTFATYDLQPQVRANKQGAASEPFDRHTPVGHVRAHRPDHVK